ncbi:MAG TPA: hypothetical protein VE978_11695 [Chitinophagales bacterium]|nr:hypothetical protein [Chitinophagales bacterium]
MSKLLFILTFSILVANAFGQVTQIVITSIERTDRTFHKKDELFLENRATKNQIIYTIDTWTKKLTTKEYLIETFYSIWDGDTTIKEQVKLKHKKWKHEISQLEWTNILAALKTNVDSLEKDMTVLHTSHHYLNVFIDVINGKDTVSYSKTKPFEYLTPWWTKEAPGLVLNPSIDTQIATHLPEKFIGRKELILVLRSALQ